MSSLLRRRRPTITVDITAAGKKVSTWHEALFTPAPTLLTFADMPLYQQENEFILSGYRPVSNSFRTCLASWMYLHNESMNIATHLFPALGFLATEALMVKYLDQFYPLATTRDHLVFGFFLACAVICMSASATYHTLTCHSHKIEALFLRLDFVGIVVQILGNFISGVHMGFYCEPDLQKFYSTLILGLGCASIVVLVSPKFQGKQWRWLRVSTFVGTGLCGFIPIGHGILMFGMEKMNQQSGMPYYLLEGLLYMCATFFYITRIPESLCPGKFDIFGGSHQIFHSIVVLATLTHFVGILSAFDFNYHHRMCISDSAFPMAT